MSDPHLNIETNADFVTTLTLARPNKHNALDLPLISALTKAFNTLAKDKSTRVLVLTGAGESFCAGADIDMMRQAGQQNEAQNLSDARALADMFFALYSAPMPTLARVNGHAFGGALGLIAACDIAIGTIDARFCLSEVRLGLIPATIAPYLAQKIAPRALMQLTLSGAAFDGQHAHNIGLLSDAVRAGQLDEHVGRVIKELLRGGPQAQRAAKQHLRSLGTPIEYDLVEKTATKIAELREREEAQEGTGAFLQKRPPIWTKP